MKIIYGVLKMNDENKKTYHTYTASEKKELVRKFYISKQTYAAFSRDNDIDRKVLARMVRDYSDIVAEEDRLKEKAKELTPADTTTPPYMINIPMVDYIEMQNKIIKYEMIINTLKQCL
jgi:hypothetical protein